MGPSISGLGIKGIGVPIPYLETGVGSNPSIDRRQTNSVGGQSSSGMVSRTSSEEPNLPIGSPTLGQPASEVESTQFSTDRQMWEEWVHSGDDMAIMVLPLATDDGDHGLPHQDPECDIDIEGEFHADQLPSSDEVSNWVLARITEVSKFMGISFARHEVEALKLFSLIETSWRRGGTDGQVVKVAGQKDKGFGSFKD
ncbi:hypothetical protein CsSME_00037580 [Camellia sinensis var. sinensis]